MRTSSEGTGPQPVRVQVQGRQLSLSNLDKVLYPQTGFTKGEVIDYYTRIAPVMLPHLRARAVTLRRFPNGVDKPSFYAKNRPAGTPNWVRTERIPTPGSSRDREYVDGVVIDELSTLVWVANLAALELHVPQWQVDTAGHRRHPDRLVIDLDPGPGTGIAECCVVGQLVAERLRGLDLDPYPKTSGSKGLQMQAALDGGRTSQQVSTLVKGIAQELQSLHPDLVVSQMSKSLRPGKVFIDWSQNAAAKTTVCVWSLRAGPRPTVSTAVTWDEVALCAAGGEELVFQAGDVLERVASQGDPWAAMLE